MSKAPRPPVAAMTAAAEPQRPVAVRGLARPDFPWWLVAAVALGLGIAAVIAANETYARILQVLSAGIATTIAVTALAFAGALALGLLVALAGLSRSRLVSQGARFYTEILRGVPILVLLFWIAFVGVPAFVAGWNAIAAPLREAGLLGELLVRDISLLSRAVAALTIGYSAFVAEIVRAGIEAVPAGQVEAAKALGLGRWKRLRLVVLPQALRTVLPPLGNDLVAMVKDSSLVSVLGVADITQMGKVYASGSFRFFETYSIVAYVYLVMTVSLSLGTRALERRLRQAHPASA